jgi:hypothetical protein
MDRLPDDELLSAYLDDELSAEERAYVERLVAERPEARRLLDELRGVRESLQSLPSYKLEPDFGAQVLQRAEREVLREPTVSRILPQGDELADRGLAQEWYEQKRWRRPLMWSIIALAAAVVLMFVDRKPEREPHLAQKPAEPVGSSAAPVVAAAPALPPAAKAEAKAKDEGHYAVMNFVPGAPSAAAAPPGVVNQAAEPNRDLDRTAVGSLMLKGGNLAGVQPPTDGLNVAQTPAAQVDVTPLVAENDYDRAQSLIADYHDIRRNATDDRAAARAFAGRVQLQQMEERQQNRSSAIAEAPLIVSCVVPSLEAVELGLEPVLRQQQIADLTQLRESQKVLSYGLVGDERKNAEAPVDEQYVYVVAERRQLEAALAELRRRSDLFNEVSVEPPATTIPSPVPASAVAGGAAIGPSATPQSAAPRQSYKADVAADEQAGVAKKNADSRSDAMQMPVQASQLAAPAGPPPSQYAYVPQSLAPLSRSQRISVTEVADREEADGRRAGEKELAKRADAPATAGAAPAAETASNRPIAPAPAKTQATAAEDTPRNRDAGRQLNDALSATQPLRGTYGAELPPDYQEALFIFRVATAENSPATPAAKPQATGKSD